MKPSSRLASIILSGLIFAAAAYPQSQKGEAPRKPDKAFTSLHRSLLVPGWGQASEKRYLEGAVFFASELAILYEIFRLSHRGNGYYASYKRAASVDEALLYRELTIKNDRRRNQMIVAAAGVWAVNLIHVHAVVKHHEAKKAKLGVKLDVQKGQAVSICIHYLY